MMNKIIISNNIIDNKSHAIVSDNRIIFCNSGNYSLEIVDSDNINIEIVLNDDIDVRLLIWSKGNNLVNNIHYLLNNNSILNVQQFYCNDSVKENVVVELNGSNSKYCYRLSSICKGYEVYDISIYHNNNNVSSYISNRCIGYDNSNIKFNIDSILSKGNLDCNMDQNTKILTLGDAKASINPNMYIEEDSVVAKHGSVISSFNQDDIFYLMSRGIDEDLAIKLLSVGFIMSNINLCDEKKKEIIEYI